MLQLILYITAIILLIYKTISSKNPKDLFLFIFFFILTFISAIYLNLSILNLLSGYIIFNIIISSYGTKKLELFILPGIYFVFVANIYGLSLITMSIFFGGISSYNIYPKKTNAIKKTTYKKEVRRNIFTILGGFAVLGLLIFTGFNEYLLMAFIFLAGITLLNNVILHNAGFISKFLYGLERDNFRLGHGALWLGIGACFALSYMSNTLALSTIGIIFIADSVSPLIGMRYNKIKLPYNKKKTIPGTISYFIAALFLSYIFIGVYAFIVAFVSAIVESLPISLDDNIDVPVALFLLAKLISI